MHQALYVVATPIGNLDDISPRCKQVLGNVDVIAAEDTRRAGKLLKSLNISPKRLVSYYDEVEVSKSKSIIETIKSEAVSVALISDAGTPCISDPGFRLIAEARKNNITVHPIPGPSALTSLISISGLPNHRILFLGFLPTKAQALRQEVESWQQLNASIVFYESPRRLNKTLQIIAEIFPEASICIGRELTKLHEETITCAIQEALAWTDAKTMKGEASVMVYPNAKKIMTIAELRPLLEEQLEKGLHLKEITKMFNASGITKSEIYRELLKIKGDLG